MTANTERCEKACAGVVAEPSQTDAKTVRQVMFEPLHKAPNGEPAVLEAIQKLQLFMEDWRKEQAKQWQWRARPMEVRRARPEPNGGHASAEDERQDSCDSGKEVLEQIVQNATLKNLGQAKRLSFFDRYYLKYAKSIEDSSLRLPAQSISAMLRAKPPVPSGRFGRWIVHSLKFELFCTFIIVCNALFMAYSTNYEAEYFDEQQPPSHYWVELGFCLFYVIELTLKIYASRCHYFFCPDWRWNVFDAVVVILSVQEQITFFLLLGANPNLSFVRLFRLLKMVKVFRMVRLMRAFREFRMLLNSIVGSLKATVWAFLLIVFLNFMFGLCLLQGTLHYMKNTLDLSENVRSGLTSWWGNLTKAMISLFMACTGGMDWYHFAEVLYVVGVEYYIAFLFYMALYTCVITNTITSLFVESTIEFAEKDTSSVISDKLERKDIYVQKLSAWFKSIDVNCCGEITFDQFVANVDDPDVLGFAETMEIELIDLRQFFAVLSCNGKNKVNLENFVKGCIKLKGMAKSMDLMSLMYSHRDATDQIHSMLRRVEANFMWELEAIRHHLEEDLASQMQQVEERLKSVAVEERRKAATAQGPVGL